MKISKLEISNVLAISRVDIECSTPILMVLGSNEAGKSSIADAVSMAILGQPARVKLKKDLGELLHDGSKKGRVTLLDGDDVIGEYRLPGGDHQVAEIPRLEFLPYLLRPRLFADMKADERRTMLFKLTGCKTSIDTTAEMMAKRGCRPDLIEEIKPLLRSGFPAAAKDAAGRATEAKGAFRALTGDNWGSKQSEDWTLHIPEAPDMPDVSPAAIDAEIEKYAVLSAEVEKGVAHMAKLEQAAEHAKNYEARKSSLEAAAVLLERAKIKLSTDQETLEDLENSLTVNQAKLREMQAGAVPVKCPCCQEELTIRGQTLEKFAGLKADTSATSDAALQVTNAKNAIEMMRCTIANDIAAVTTAENAANELEAHIKDKPKDVSEEVIQKGSDALASTREKANKLRIRVEAMKQRQELLASADQTEHQAHEHHQNVLDWLLVADALAPDGIPADILASALKPVNDSLAILSRLSGWKKVEIDRDMEITATARSYGLMSESAQWRIDTLIACAIAQISELRFLVVDRFDVLDMKGRSQCIGLLRELAGMGLLDQSIVCGTLKALMPEIKGVTQVWIENGKVQGA